MLLNTFTFQSGYIQIRSSTGQERAIYSFTFQSGYIQIQEPSLHAQTLLFFTFQSGYIQIWADVYGACMDDLYIPIWLYSNLYIIAKYLSPVILYIPIWLYSNYHLRIAKRAKSFSLHSNLVIFKFKIIIVQKLFYLLYIPIWLYSNVYLGFG